jgi:hypothetical protein
METDALGEPDPPGDIRPALDLDVIDTFVTDGGRSQSATPGDDDSGLPGRRRTCQSSH